MMQLDYSFVQGMFYNLYFGLRCKQLKYCKSLYFSSIFISWDSWTGQKRELNGHEFISSTFVRVNMVMLHRIKLLVLELEYAKVQRWQTLAYVCWSLLLQGEWCTCIFIDYSWNRYYRQVYQYQISTKRLLYKVIITNAIYWLPDLLYHQKLSNSNL